MKQNVVQRVFNSSLKLIKKTKINFLGSKNVRLAPIRSLFKTYTGRRPGIPAKPDKKVLFAYTAIIEKASKTQNVLKQFALLAPRALDCPHDNTIIISLGPRSFDWPQ